MDAPMLELAREANRVAKALRINAQSLREEPATRQHARAVASLLCLLADHLQEAVDAALPTTGPLDPAQAPPKEADRGETES